VLAQVKGVELGKAGVLRRLCFGGVHGLSLGAYWVENGACKKPRNRARPPRWGAWVSW
jgi:hypothetical protein